MPRGPQSEGRCISMSQTEMRKKKNQVILAEFLDEKIQFGVSSGFTFLCFGTAFRHVWFCVCLLCEHVHTVYICECKYKCNTHIKAVREGRQLLWHLDALTFSSAYFSDTKTGEEQTTVTTVQLRMYCMVLQVWLYTKFLLIICQRQFYRMNSLNIGTKTASSYSLLNIMYFLLQQFLWSWCLG